MTWLLLLVVMYIMTQLLVLFVVVYMVSRCLLL